MSERRQQEHNHAGVFIRKIPKARWRYSITLAVLAKKAKPAGVFQSRWPSWPKRPNTLAVFYHAGRLDHKSTNTLAVLYKAGRLDPKRQTRWRCSITLAVLAKKKKHAGGVLSRWPSWSKKEKHACGITSGWPSCIPPAVIPVIDIPDIATNVSTCGAGGALLSKPARGCAPQ